MDAHLKEIVLLGTSRRQLNPDQLPEVIASRLDQRLDAEKQVLQALSYSVYLAEIGPGLPNLIAPDPIQIVAEERPTTPPALATILNDILTLEHISKQRWLKKWLAIVDNRKEKIPPEAVVKLMATLHGLGKKAQQRAYQVLGETTRNIFNTYKLWPFPTEITKEETNEVWKYGKADQRLAYWTQLHQLDAKRAIELLQEDWVKESIREKWSFLNAVAQDLQMADQSFLVHLHETEFVGKRLNSKTARAAKRLIIGLLIRLDYAPLRSELVDQLKPYLKEAQASGLLRMFSAKKQKVLDIPRQEGGFWMAEGLASRYGIETKNTAPDRFEYDPLFWWEQFIALLPLEFLMECLERSAEETIKYWLNTPAYQTQINGEKVAIYQQTWVQKAVQTQDEKLIATLTKVLDWKAASLLVPLMPALVFEKYVTEHQLFEHIETFQLRGYEAQEGWSVGFSKKMIDCWIRLFAKKTYAYQSQANHFTAYFHPDAFPYLRMKSASLTNSTAAGHWQRYILDPLETNLKVRTQMEPFER